jgi:hypothetical protein
VARSRCLGPICVSILVSILVAAGGGGRARADGLRANPLLLPEASLLAGPSLRETGRVAAIPFAHPGPRIEWTPAGVSLREHPVRPVLGEAPRVHIGFISDSLLEHEMRQPVAALETCRIEVARRQNQRWNQVEAGRVTLRWTILPTGAISQIEVKPLDPLDLHVLDCVKGAMALWTFASPSWGVVTVVHPFAFR